MAVADAAARERIMLHGVSWDLYERLLRAYEDSSTPRLTYDHGDLEIVSPLPRHEWYNRVAQLAVPALAAGLGVRACSLGSVTLRRQPLGRGREADSCFYLVNRERVRGKDRIDLAVDAPPDLVVEIELTRLAIPTLPIYAEFGVPEVWRYDVEAMTFLSLHASGYVSATRSRLLPPTEPDALAALFEEIRDLDDWDRPMRAHAWGRELGGQRASREVG